MDTIASLGIRIESNAKQLVEDLRQLEIQTSKTEQATVKYTNSTLILSQKTQAALIAEKAARVADFATQLNQIAEMKRVQDRVASEHQAYLNKMVAAEKESANKIAKIWKELYSSLGASAKADTRTVSSGGGYMPGISQGPSPAQIAAQTQAIANQNAILAQRTALYSNFTSVMGGNNGVLRQNSEISANMIRGMTQSANAIQQNSTALRQHNEVLNQTHSMFDRVITKALAITTAMIAYRTISALVSVPKEIFNTNVEMEKLKILLEGVVGSTEKAKIAFQNLLKLDFKTPFDIKGLTQTFITLKNYGIEPTDRVMKALTDSVSKLGGGSDKLNNIAIQLGQAWSKNKLQMQDMRVIIDNGLPVISLLAKQLHVTAGDVLEMSKNGTLTTSVISDLFDTMEREAPNAAAKNMNTLYGALSNVHTAWIQLQNAFLEDKSESVIKRMLEDWSMALQDITKRISSIGTIQGDLIKNSDKLKEVREAIGHAEKNPLMNTIGNVTFGLDNLSELKDQEAQLLDQRNKLLKQSEQQSKINNTLQKESETDIANNKSLLSQQELLLENQNKYSIKENDTRNVVIESQISDLKRITDTKINDFLLEKENITELANEHKISIDEKYKMVSEINTKIYSLEVQLAEKTAQLQKSKIAEVKTDFEAWWAAYLKVESYGGKPGTISKKMAAGGQYAIGATQTLPTTMVDPGLKGISPFKPAVEQNILAHKADLEWLQKFLKENEPALTAWTKTYAQLRFIENKGDPLKTFANVGDAKYLKMYSDSLGTINGQKIKQIGLDNDSKDLEITLSNLKLEYAKNQKDLEQEVFNNKEKEKKLIEDQQNSIQKLLDAEMDRYNKLTMSENDYYRLKLAHTEISPGINLPQQSVEQIMSFHNANDELDKSTKAAESARQAVKNYADSIDITTHSMSNLGEVTSSIFDASIGGISQLAGIFKSVTKAIQENGKALQQNKKDLEDIKNMPLPDINIVGEKQYSEAIIYRDKAFKKASKEEQALQIQQTQTAISGVRQIAGASAEMFKENTTGRRVLHNVEMALSAVEMAMQIKKLAVDAAGAVLNQGKGDPYTAFARIAAMAAIVAGIVAAAGGVFGGTSSGAAPTNSQGTGTVLGDTSANSQSINNVVTTLKDIQAQNYPELRGINESMKSLQSGITNVITKVFQTGGLVEISLGKVSQGLTDTWNKVTFAQFDPIAKFIGKGLFGKTTQSIVGSGIQTSAFTPGQEVTGNQFTDIQTTKKSWFSTKTKYSTVLTGLNSDVQSALTDVFKSMGDTMLQVAGSVGKTIGVDVAQRVMNYVVPSMRIELKGLTGQEASDKLNAVVSAALDQMSTTVFGDILGQYQQLGEGMLETAIRIVSEVAVVKDALAQSGLSLGQNAIAIADDLIKAAGGIKEFQTAFATYYDKFFSDIEKQTRLQSSLNSQLEDLYLLLPQTRDGYKNLIQSLDLNNELDRKRYSLLLNLASSANDYYTVLEQKSAVVASKHELELKLMEASGDTLGALTIRRQDELAAMDESLRATQTYIYRLTDLTDAHTKAAQAAKDLVNSAMAILNKSVGEQKTIIKNNLDNLTKAITDQKNVLQTTITDLGSSVSNLTSLANTLTNAVKSSVIPGNELNDRIDAQKRLQNRINTGTLPNQDNLNDILTTLAKPSEDLFRNFTDFKRDSIKTSNNILALSKIADAQLGKVKTQLQLAQDQSTALDKSLKLAQDQATIQNDQLDKIIRNNQDLVDKANGTYVETINVNDAVNGVTDAVNAMKKQSEEATIETNSLLKQIAGEKAAAALAEAAKLKADAETRAAAEKAMADAKRAADAQAAAQRAAQEAAAAEARRNQLASYRANVPTTIAPGQTNNPYWEKVISASDARHKAQFGIGMNRAWTADADAMAAYATLKAEYLASIPAFASGGFHSGGLAIVGEHGPELVNMPSGRVYNHNDSKQLLNADNQELLAEIRALRNEVNLLRTSSEDTSRNTKKTSDLLRNVTQDGNSLLTTPA